MARAVSKCCVAMCRCCQRPHYQRLILSLYPPDAMGNEPDLQPQNLSRLLTFGARFPSMLPAIGR